MTQATWGSRNSEPFQLERTAPRLVPFLYGGVVNRFHWLTEQQFLDAIAVTMITPRAVVITAAFIGYLVAGLVGGSVAAIAVFAPPFLIVILAAP